VGEPGRNRRAHFTVKTLAHSAQLAFSSKLGRTRGCLFSGESLCLESASPG
jgi:hypothetical protein